MQIGRDIREDIRARCAG